MTNTKLELTPECDSEHSNKTDDKEKTAEDICATPEKQNRSEIAQWWGLGQWINGWNMLLKQVHIKWGRLND